MQCNVNIRKLLSTHKSHVGETSLFIGAMPNQVRNSQTSLSFQCHVKIREGQAEETAYVGLRLQSGDDG